MVCVHLVLATYTHWRYQFAEAQCDQLSEFGLPDNTELNFTGAFPSVSFSWAMLIFLLLVCCRPPLGSTRDCFSPARIATASTLLTIATVSTIATALDCSFAATRPRQYLARQLVSHFFISLICNLHLITIEIWYLCRLKMYISCIFYEIDTICSDSCWRHNHWR